MSPAAQPFRAQPLVRSLSLTPQTLIRAEAFVMCRNLMKRACAAGLSKEAGWSEALGSVADYIGRTPWAQGALLGAGIGGVTGLFSSKPGSVLRNALWGAGLGGGLGGVYQWATSPYEETMPAGAQPIPNAEKDPNKRMPPIPRSAPHAQQHLVPATTQQ